MTTLKFTSQHQYDPSEDEIEPIDDLDESFHVYDEPYEIQYLEIEDKYGNITNIPTDFILSMWQAFNDNIICVDERTH